MMMPAVFFSAIFIISKSRNYFFIFLFLLSIIITWINSSSTFFISYIISQVFIFFFFYKKILTKFWIYSFIFFFINCLIFFLNDNCTRKITDINLKNVFVKCNKTSSPSELINCVNPGSSGGLTIVKPSES